LISKSLRPASVAVRSRTVKSRVTMAAANFHNLEALDIEKKPVKFSALDGKVVMVVNVATA